VIALAVCLLVGGAIVALLSSSRDRAQPDVHPGVHPDLTRRTASGNGRQAPEPDEPEMQLTVAEVTWETHHCPEEFARKCRGRRIAIGGRSDGVSIKGTSQVPKPYLRFRSVHRIHIWAFFDDVRDVLDLPSGLVIVGTCDGISVRPDSSATFVTFSDCRYSPELTEAFWSRPPAVVPDYSVIYPGSEPSISDGYVLGWDVGEYVASAVERKSDPRDLLEDAQAFYDHYVESFEKSFSRIDEVASRNHDTVFWPKGIAEGFRESLRRHRIVLKPHDSADATRTSASSGE
jgi:hypothetical protein